MGAPVGRPVSLPGTAGSGRYRLLGDTTGGQPRPSDKGALSRGGNGWERVSSPPL